VVQSHCFGVIELRILKLAEESGFTCLRGVSEGKWRDSWAQLGLHAPYLKENIKRIFSPSDIVGIAHYKIIIIIIIIC